MSCTFCKKSSPSLIAHNLCNCCLENLHGSSGRASAAVSPEDVAPKSECDICLERYPEDELEQHREACVTRFVLQCTVCEQDYLNKEGLWNHLDMHEIADSKKDLYYEERRAKHVLHSCTLCNDQRGYQESLYWSHIHEDHDGFFLRCTDCGDCFRSLKQKTIHSQEKCSTRQQTVPTVIKTEYIPEVENQEESMEQVDSLDLETVSSLKQECIDIIDIQPNEPPIIDTSHTELESSVAQTSDDDTAVHCDICNKDYNKSTSLNDVCHKLKYHSEPCYKCYYCNQAIELLKVYRSHLIGHQKKYFCDICGQKFQHLVNLNSHRKRAHQKKSIEHSSPRFVCPLCPQSFHLKKNLQLHMSEHSESPDKPAQRNPALISASLTICNLCDKDCYNKRSLRRHFDSCHLVITCNECGKVSEGRHKAQYHKLMNHTEPTIDCTHCSKRFHSMSIFRRHLKMHSRVDCRTCGIMFDDAAELKQHQIDVHAKPGASQESASSGLECMECGKKFNYSRSLMRHKDSCHIPMKCKICGIISAGRERARYHKLKFHTEPAYTCQICSKNFHIKLAFRRHLIRHYKIKSSGNKRNFNKEEQVRSDDMAKPEASNRSKHRAEQSLENKPSTKRTKHSEEKEAVIEQDKKITDFQPTTVDDLIIRMESSPKNSAHEPSSAKLAAKKRLPKTSKANELECSHCDKICKNKSLLNRHIEYSHTAFPCSKCGVTVKGKTQLNYHQLTAHTEPKYECPQCSKKIHVKASFLRHMACHKKGTIINCEICQAVFRTESCFKLHMKRDHQITSSGTNSCELSRSSSSLSTQQEDDSVVIKQEIHEDEIIFGI